MNTQYQAPESELLEPGSESGELASRWSRLVASFVDGLIVIIPVFPLIFILGLVNFDDPEAQPTFMEGMIISLVYLAVFLLLNLKFLLRDGQTIAKKLLKIRIVDLHGNLPDPKGNLLPRYALYMLVGQIPVIGPILALVNVLFIFRSDKRCVHDLVGKTRVVKC